MTVPKAQPERSDGDLIEAWRRGEESAASEIINPNDELPITLVYHRLQKQYQVYTSLAEVSAVMLVAKTVPRWDQLDEVWIRKYDAIISRVLLDESYRGSLEAIRAYEEPQTDNKLYISEMSTNVIQRERQRPKDLPAAPRIAKTAKSGA